MLNTRFATLKLHSYTIPKIIISVGARIRGQQYIEVRVRVLVLEHPFGVMRLRIPPSSYLVLASLGGNSVVFHSSLAAVLVPSSKTDYYLSFPETISLCFSCGALSCFCCVPLICPLMYFTSSVRRLSCLQLFSRCLKYDVPTLTLRRLLLDAGHIHCGE